MSNSRENWVFDGVPLNTEYSGVVNRSAGWGVPSKDGTNTPNPNSDGSTWQPHKPFVQKTLPFQMWVTGATDDPTLDPKTLMKMRIDDFTRLFGRSSNLYRLERKHYMDGATNRVTNPSIKLDNLVTRPTGITKLASANYTTPAAGFVGFEFPQGSSPSITVDGVLYSYPNLRHAIAGWVKVGAAKVISGTLPTGANAYFYNPATANHVKVANVFPLPKVVEQWQPVTWSGGKVLAVTADGTGKFVLATPAGGKYTYSPDGATITPVEAISQYYVESTLAPVFVTELPVDFPQDIKLDTIPTSLFQDVIFKDASRTTVEVPHGNLTFVPTSRGYVLPAQGTSLNYDTSTWAYPGSTLWHHLTYSSGSVIYQGVKPQTVVDPLGVGDTIVSGSAWVDAYFGTGQTVTTTVKNAHSYVVSPTVVKKVGVYTHPEKFHFPPEFVDGDSYGATWVGTPHNSQTIIHTSRWIDVENPIDGIDFNSMAGGTRSEFNINFAAPSVYWRDNQTVTDTFSWTQSAAQSGNDYEWASLKFDGTTGPLGGVMLEIETTCTQSGFDVNLEVYDTSTRRTAVLTVPVNQTWLLNADQFLFYQTSPQLSIDRYASFARVSRSFGGSLITISPIQEGYPILVFKTQEFPTQTITFDIKLTAHRRYLSA